MALATVTGKGQITVPLEVRRALGLEAGTRVNFVRTDSGSYELVPETRSVSTLKGMIAAPQTPVSLAEMDTAFAEGAAEISGR